MNEELDISNLDAPPVDPLESIFVLPDSITDERVRGWYNEMVSSLRREAQGVPMKTAQYTLMERIAFFYAYMREQEFNNPTMSGREKLQNIAAWQTMLDQFNRMLEKHNDKIIQDMLVQVQDIIRNSVAVVSDAGDRQALLRKLQEEFAKADM